MNFSHGDFVPTTVSTGHFRPGHATRRGGTEMDAMKGRAYRLMFSAASLVTLAVTTGAARKFG